ncbi:MAG: error-prone DNA polymerase [Planctomycetota bacterium]|nr:error-prone DNA polymerase [Planctomycetota bacterium]
MPEQPEPKRAPTSARSLAASSLAAAEAPRAGIPYAELHCKTNFSLLEGASHADELVATAHQFGYTALAVTDRNTLAGVVRAHAAAKDVGLKLLIGAEITPLDAPPVVLLATDRAAYGRLSRLITRGRQAAEKGECRLTLADIAEYSTGLLAGSYDGLAQYREIFADRCYRLVGLHHVDDAAILERAVQSARQAGVPIAACGDVLFHEPGRRPLADVLTAIRAGCTVADASELLPPNAERHLKSPAQIAALFAKLPEAIQRTIEIADRCNFSLDELRYEYPEELAPAGSTPLAHLQHLTWEGAVQRYPHGIPPKVHQLLVHELSLIAELRYEAYFLTVWDLVRFANSQQILCQGRGSAANSAVCYCLGVTSVDPDQQDVLFERFISRERNEAPDIDVDFEHERREEVLQYIYSKYGRERAAMTAEVISYRPRSAVRDVGKALGLSLDRVDAIAKRLDHYKTSKIDRRLQMAGLDPDSAICGQLRELVEQLLGFPRHLGQHVGGMVITQGPLCEMVPIENAAMPDRTVIEWDKDDLDELGILKVDCLSLGMLTAIRKCFALVQQHHGRELTLATVPAEDPAVYDMICRADTIGVFQIESRAQMSMLPRLKPREFYDLVIEVAIVRPGPIQGNMVHPYLRRRALQEEVTYPNEAIREVLHKTLGVPLFQEQAMRLAVVAAGFTPGEADQLRRAMAAWRRPGVIEIFRERLLAGMLTNGLDAEFAESVFRQIKGFGEYGFPESHAASFARLAYVSSWLKCHYAAAFCVALINSQPMGFYAPAQLIRNAQEHGVEIRPIDVNQSDWDCTLERGVEESENPTHAIRLGLRMIDGLGESAGRAIEETRQADAFTTIAQFGQRTRLHPAAIRRLAEADAFRSLALDRRQSLWQSLGERKQNLPLFSGCAAEVEPLVALPDMTAQEQVLADYQTSGLSLRAHPISFFRQQLTELRVVPAAALAEIANGRFVRVAGLVLVRQRPSTAKGITFVTLEDESGTANLIVRSDVWERYYEVARTAPAFIAHGRLQKQESIIHVLVAKLEALGGQLSTLESQSRDFR